MKKIIPILALAIVLSACISIETQPTQTPAPAEFITATLPPTKAGYVSPTPSATPAITLTPTFAVTIDPNCNDSAVLLRDVTIPDGTILRAGETFTKTWEFMNNGSCPWYGYTLKYAAGDQMSAPLSAPVPVTLTKELVQVSVQLTAPSADGEYTGYFTLNDPTGKDVPIGIEKTFWVKIRVGSGGTVPQPTTSGSVPTTSVVTGGNCSYSQNADYVNQIASAINQERANAGLPELTINPILTNAAQAHAAGMACSGRISHTGSDGSSPYARIQTMGYTPSYYEEIIYGGGGPQAAMTWWMNDQIHRDAILNPKSTEMGVGYAYYANGSYGDYFAVELGSP
ncbi:MAG: hypothetical protein H6635_16460 [Anaerolineales bacterium]|nr:hypothetical protein [Anaerolineales bacterium]MCB9146953.1 hypothetical protein [Anaerolineales bacterium]